MTQEKLLNAPKNILEISQFNKEKTWKRMADINYCVAFLFIGARRDMAKINSHRR